MILSSGVERQPLPVGCMLSLKGERVLQDHWLRRHFYYQRGISKVDWVKEKEVALEAALEAGRYIKQRLGRIDRIDYKSAFNIVTDVDKSSEALIVEHIKQAFPADSIVAEEGSGASEKPSNRCWFIDPLDGTTNFTHSYPFFAVSIGFASDDAMVVGVVYSPVSDEKFVAVKGQGAYLNDQRIAVSTVSDIETSLLATGFPADTSTATFNNLEIFQELTNRTHGVRRDGSAALDLCFVATGRLDAFWEMKLSPWDVAAGSLIVEEAGGRVTNLVSGEFDRYSGHILASNGLIHQDVAQILKTFRAVRTTHDVKA
ncbi:MAG TPA: inositol monophosphatase family protein [Oculatellaceae cyanobacterium]